MRILWIIQFLVALAEGAIAITASGFCCRVVCGGSKKMETRSVLYSPTTLGNPQFSPVPMNVLPTAIPQGQGNATNSLYHVCILMCAYYLGYYGNAPVTVVNPQFNPVPMNVLPTAIPQRQGNATNSLYVWMECRM